MLLTDSPNMTRRLGSFAGASLISLLARVHKSPLHKVVASCLSCISNNKLSTERIGAKWWVLHSINQTWRCHVTSSWGDGTISPVAYAEKTFRQDSKKHAWHVDTCFLFEFIKNIPLYQYSCPKDSKGMKSVSSVKTLTTNGWLIGILIQVGYQRLPVCGAPWAQIIKSFNKCSERNWYCARLPSI